MVGIRDNLETLDESTGGCLVDVTELVALVPVEAGNPLVSRRGSLTHAVELSGPVLVRTLAPS